MMQLLTSSTFIQITPYENIRQSAIRAVQASRSNTAREIVSQNRQTYVKESADTYCDLSGVKSDLVAAGEWRAEGDAEVESDSDAESRRHGTGH